MPLFSTITSPVLQLFTQSSEFELTIFVVPVHFVHYFTPLVKTAASPILQFSKQLDESELTLSVVPVHLVQVLTPLTKTVASPILQLMTQVYESELTLSFVPLHSHNYEFRMLVAFIYSHVFTQVELSIAILFGHGKDSDKATKLIE